ncbi:MAG: hypothetical protein IKY54_06550, partial [Muribaculaceae bacterium]|nr:hypothetical protein [Muribaculaceae bacterium]
MREIIKNILLFIFFIIGFPLLAQTSFGGTPPSWNTKKSILKSEEELKSHIISNPFTIEELLKDEEESQDMPE